jgi:hypothetical protein
MVSFAAACNSAAKTNQIIINKVLISTSTSGDMVSNQAGWMQIILN